MPEWQDSPTSDIQAKAQPNRPHSIVSLPRDDDIEYWTSEKRAQEEKRLVRKLDLRLMPMVASVLIMNYVDRTAITTARLQGLEQDLHLSDIQYDSILAIFYLSYCIFQVPSNMLLNKISRPSLYIGTCAVIWGLVSAMTGVTRNLGGIAACRVFIGLPEASFYPGAMYLLSRWYTRRELAFRTALMYSGFSVASAFGGLAAAGILNRMPGVRGIAAWRWLFYIEGSTTIAIGFLAMWALPDYPHNTRWICGAQRRLAQARMAKDAAEADQDDVGESLLVGLKMALKDYRIWIFAFSDAMASLGTSFGYFFPTLTATLGYSTTNTLLLTVPPYILGAAYCLLNAWHADKTGERFFHIVGGWWLVIIAYIIALCTMSTAGRYVSMCVMTAGGTASSLTLVWVSNTISRPPAKRAAAIGIVNTCSNFGSLIGSFAWQNRWSPSYRPSMAIGIAALAAGTCSEFVMRTILVRANRRLDQQDLDMHNGGDEGNAARVREAARLEGIETEEAIRRRRGHRYLY